MPLRGALLLAIATAATACSGGNAAPDASTDAGSRPLIVDHIDDVGAFPAPTTVVGRDGTTSALIGDRVLWTFGDTFLTKPAADDGTSVRSSTAAWSTVDAPLALDEPVDSAGLPFELVPYTPAELAQNQTDPQNGYALWPGAVIATSDTEAVVLFQHVVRKSGGFNADAIGTAHVTKNATQATRDAAFLFRAPDPLFGNAGVTIEGGNAYFFECESTGILDDHCKLARVPVASVTERSAFQFWDGTAYTSDVTRAAWFIDHASYGLSIEYNPWLGRYLAVYSKPLSNDIGLRTAERIEGPWTDPEVVIAGSTSGLVTSEAGVNYLAHEHSELRSADGRTVVIGYAHPLPNFGGACRLARIVLR
ncbi:MAG: DUF4185 domain-containing protein [Polyangia bacterium]